MAMLQPSEYLIQRLRANSSPLVYVSPSTTPPKYAEVVTSADAEPSAAAASWSSGSIASPAARSPLGSLDCLSGDVASSTDGYINGCIRAVETVRLSRADLPDGSRQWHAVMQELSPRHSTENLSAATAAAPGPSAMSRRGSDKSTSRDTASSPSRGQPARERSNTMPSLATASALSKKKGSPSLQRVRFA